MGQLLAFNLCWFAIIFLSAYTPSRLWRAGVVIMILFLGTVSVFYGWLDPFSWFLYFLFSWVVFISTSRFRQWALGGILVLERETTLLARELDRSREELAKKEREVLVTHDRAEEISNLYDKIKEMSESLDMFETFVIFGEALSRYFQFDRARLALFSDDISETPKPSDFFEIRYENFKGVFDRNALLRDRKRATTQLFPSDQVVIDRVCRKPEPIESMETGARIFSAYPAFLDNRIFALLFLEGIDSKSHAMVSVLTQRFVAEIHRVKLYERVQTLAITDGLTGVYVRRHLTERFEGELDRSKRFGHHLSFLMIDIDHFKRFNDEYGHLVGDVVLKQVAETLRRSVRELDLVGRYGGEEFGVLLIETDESGAFFVADRIRRAIEEKIFKAYDESLKVTISVGCSTLSKKLDDVSVMVEAADSALYQAKRQGRNRVCSAEVFKN